MSGRVFDTYSVMSILSPLTRQAYPAHLEQPQNLRTPERPVTRERRLKQDVYVTCFERALRVDGRSIASGTKFVHPASTIRQREQHNIVALRALQTRFGEADSDGRKLVREGMLELLKSEPEEAEKWIRLGLARIDEPAPLMLLLGESLRMQKKPWEAISCLDKAALGWSSPALSTATGLAYWQLELWGAAEKAFDYACRPCIGHPMPWYLRGAMRAVTGQLEKSAADLSVARRLSGDHVEVVRCYDLVQSAIDLRTSYSVNCGVDPSKVPCCVSI